MMTKVKNDIQFKTFHDKGLGEAFALIAKHQLYNSPEDDSTTILPLLETGSNYQGDTPEICVLAFNKESQEPVAMGLLTTRKTEDGSSYCVGHLYVSKETRGHGIGSQLIKSCLELAEESKKVYWYYTDASRNLYEKHKLNDVVLFEAMEGIYRDEPSFGEYGHQSIESGVYQETSGKSFKSSKKKRFHHS